MAKIEINPVPSGFYTTLALNNRFQQIEEALNDKVLWRDNPIGEPNQMSNLLDMADYQIINLPAGVEDHEPVTVGQVRDLIANDLQYLYNRTLRVEDEIPALPSVSLRANKLAGFNSRGQPIAVDANPETVPDLALRIEDLEDNRVQSVATIADLSVLSPTVGQRVVTQGAITPGFGASDYVVQAASGAPDGFARVLLANGNHAVLIPKNNTVTPEQFGAIGDGTTLDAAAFVRMANFIKAAGGGHAKGTPGQTYLLADASSSPGLLISLGDIPHFEMDFNGATIKGTNAEAQGTIILFAATDGKNITIKNAVCDFPLLVNETFDPIGVTLFVGYDKCENVEVSGLSGPGGFESIIAFERSNTAAFLEYEDQARGITVKNIDLEAVGYGINCRFNGSYLTARSIKLGYCHRGYFPYGVTNHDVEIELNDYDATGCRLWGVGGRTLRNITLKVRVARAGGITRIATAAVNFALSGTTPAAFRNIKVEVDADLAGLHGIGVSFDIEQALPSSQHQIYDVDIKANIRNAASRIVTYRETGGGVFANHAEFNLMKFSGRSSDAASNAVLPNYNSTTVALVSDVIITGGAATGFQVAGNSTKSVTFRGCDTGTLYAATAMSDYTDCVIGNVFGIVPSRCTFRNTLVGPTLVNKSLRRHVLPPNENTIQSDLIAARLVSQSASPTLTLTVVSGTYIYPDQLPVINAGSCVYDFAIGVTGTSSSVVGVYTGRVMMKASSGGVVTAISLIDVSVAHSSGAALQASDLAVSLNSGSPVFTLTSTLTNYTQGQLIIRDI